MFIPLIGWSQNKFVPIEPLKPISTCEKCGAETYLVFKSSWIIFMLIPLWHRTEYVYWCGNCKKEAYPGREEHEKYREKYDKQFQGYNVPLWFKVFGISMVPVFLITVDLTLSLLVSAILATAISLFPKFNR